MNYVNQVCGSNWTQTNAKSRFEGFISKYKEAKRTSGQTGWGLDEEDIARGINTIESKLERMAPHFTELDKLYGDRPNVNPPAIIESIGAFEPELEVSTYNLLDSAFC
jgi:hypothetical protein